MNVFWSRFPNLTVKVLQATREQDPGIQDFFDSREYLELDSDAHCRLALSFKVPQLQRLIVANNKREHRRTLAKCARVCRSLSGYALTLLWSEVPTTDAIFSLFPGNIPSDIPMDWRRFETCHKKVRSLAICEDMQTDAMLLKSLFKLYPFGPSSLFPKLESLVWDTPLSDRLLEADVFLSDHLRSLDLRAPPALYYHSTPMKLLYQLRYHAPALTSLSLTGSFVTMQSLDAFHNVGRLTQLREFKLLQDQGWVDFPSREELCPFDGPRGYTPLYFSSLKSLTLQGPAHYIMAIFDHLRCFPQKYMCLRLTSVPTVKDLSAIFQRIAAGGRVSRTELEHIELSLIAYPLVSLIPENPWIFHRMSLSDRATAKDRILIGQSFTPLACFRSLHHLELRQLGVMVSLCDEDIKWMALVWPKLTFLGLDTHTNRLELPAAPSEYEAAVPITSMHLFTHFRHLQVLKLNVRLLDRSVLFRLIENMDAWAAQETPRASMDGHPLWGINIDLTPIRFENQEPIVEYLRRIFPRLTLLKRRSYEEIGALGTILRGQKEKLVQFTTKRNYDIKDVAPLTSKKWEYRAWCL